MTLTLSRDRFPLAEVFTISRGSKTGAEVLTATVTRDGVSGRGECVPYARYGESLDSVGAEIQGQPGGVSRSALEVFRREKPAWVGSFARTPDRISVLFYDLIYKKAHATATVRFR